MDGAAETGSMTAEAHRHKSHEVSVYKKACAPHIGAQAFFGRIRSLP